MTIRKRSAAAVSITGGGLLKRSARAYVCAEHLDAAKIFSRNNVKPDLKRSPRGDHSSVRKHCKERQDLMLSKIGSVFVCPKCLGARAIPNDKPPNYPMRCVMRERGCPFQTNTNAWRQRLCILRDYQNKEEASSVIHSRNHVVAEAFATAKKLAKSTGDEKVSEIPLAKIRELVSGRLGFSLQAAEVVALPRGGWKKIQVKAQSLRKLKTCEADKQRQVDMVESLSSQTRISGMPHRVVGPSLEHLRALLLNKHHAWKFFSRVYPSDAENPHNTDSIMQIWELKNWEWKLKKENHKVYVRETGYVLGFRV